MSELCPHGATELLACPHHECHNQVMPSGQVNWGCHECHVAEGRIFPDCWDCSPPPGDHCCVEATTFNEEVYLQCTVCACVYHYVTYVMVRCPIHWTSPAYTVGPGSSTYYDETCPSCGAGQWDGETYRLKVGVNPMKKNSVYP